MLKHFIMKKDTTHSSLLGFTQGQMALLLNVHPTQWSMYESKKRNLPLKAKQLLAEMLGFLKFEHKGPKVQQHLIEQEELKKKYLEKQLRKNEDEQYVIAKKIALAERKYNSNITVIGLVDYLTTHPATKEALDMELLEIIVWKAEDALKKFGLAHLTELRLKEELLQQEKLLLHSQLQKIT